MKVAALVTSIPILVPTIPAQAEPTWRLDLSARGVASIELESGAMQPRAGLVPALGIRALRRIGSVQLGGTIGGGFPAYYGKADAALSIDYVVALGGERLQLATGLDAGVGLLYAGAPPETSASSNALIYWGPLARARVQLHVLDILPNGRAVGLVAGVNAAITSAHYMSTADDTGLRLEPEVEVGITMRL